MALARFSRYLLRTTDVEAAGKFYDAVLGRRGDGIVALHEAAISRGARPHWLGHVSVHHIGGADSVAANFVARGATRLGPPVGVGDFVVLRDAGGAIVAVTDGVAESKAGVVWHQLNASDPTSSAADYSTLFGWLFTSKIDLGSRGRHQHFAFGAGSANCGVISDIQGRPGVHTHWLFFFGVPSLDSAIGRVREHGGVVLGPTQLLNGVRIAACDDAQGAAFGLIEAHDADPTRF